MNFLVFMTSYLVTFILTVSASVWMASYFGTLWAGFIPPVATIGLCGLATYVILRRTR